MRPVFMQACVFLFALAGFAAGCAPASPGLVDNPTYKAWADFEPGAKVVLQGTRKVGQETHKSRYTQRLVEVTPQQVVLERTLELLDGNSQAPTVTCKVEPAQIDPADNPRTNPQARVKDLGEERIEIKGKALPCKGTEVVVHAEFGGPLPTSEDVHLRSWVSPEIPGGVARLFLVRKSVSHDMEISAQTTDYQAQRRKPQ